MIQEPPDLPDYSTRKYSKHLVATIRQFWHSRGHVNVWVEPIEIEMIGGHRYWGVRSNLVNGRPPGRETKPRLDVEPRIGSPSNFESFGITAASTRHGATA